MKKMDSLGKCRKIVRLIKMPLIFWIRAKTAFLSSWIRHCRLRQRARAISPQGKIWTLNSLIHLSKNVKLKLNQSTRYRSRNKFSPGLRKHLWLVISILNLWVVLLASRKKFIRFQTSLKLIRCPQPSLSLLTRKKVTIFSCCLAKSPFSSILGRCPNLSIKFNSRLSLRPNTVFNLNRSWSKQKARRLAASVHLQFSIYSTPFQFPWPHSIPNLCFLKQRKAMQNQKCSRKTARKTVFWLRVNMLRRCYLVKQ